MLPGKVPPLLAIHPGEMNRTLALDEPDHLTDWMFRRDRDQIVNMVGHQVAFENLTSLLLGQRSEHFPKMGSKLLVDYLLPALVYELRMVITPPFGVA